ERDGRPGWPGGRAALPARDGADGGGGGVGRTRALLWCGVLAGPLLVVVLLGQAMWNPRYDLGTDAISTLSLGADGWVQIVTFVVVGVLVAGFGLGVRRVRRGSALTRAGGTLLVVMGAGVAGIGAFVL